MNSLQLLAPLMRALAFLQMIEEGLRLYVGTAEEIIEAAAPYGVAFRVDRKRILSASLGKLIDMFAKLNRNEPLISRLRQLPKHRNYIAHAAFMRAIQSTVDKQIDVEYAKKHAKEVGDEAEQILWLVAEEMKALRQNYPGTEIGSLGGKDSDV